MSEFLSLSQLHDMIGLRLLREGEIYTVIEILDDIPAVIIEADHPATSIQLDVHGYARRQIKDTVIIPVLNEDKTDPNPEFISLTWL